MEPFTVFGKLDNEHPGKQPLEEEGMNLKIDERGHLCLDRNTSALSLPGVWGEDDSEKFKESGLARGKSATNKREVGNLKQLSTKTRLPRMGVPDVGRVVQDLLFRLMFFVGLAARGESCKKQRLQDFQTLALAAAAVFLVVVVCGEFARQPGKPLADESIKSIDDPAQHVATTAADSARPPSRSVQFVSRNQRSPLPGNYSALGYN